MNITRTTQKEIDRLPQGFDHLSDEMRLLVATLRGLSFFVIRADGVKDYVQVEKDDLQYYAGQPSIMLTPRDSKGLIKAHQKRIHTAKPDDYELFVITNKIMHATLEVQQQLFQLLQMFYANRSSSYHTQLIVEGDFGSIFLKPLGADIRPLLDKTTQKQWVDDMQKEITDFGVFLMHKLENKITAK